MRTEAGHHDFFDYPILSLYHPTFPHLEHRISTPRDPQTLEYCKSSWIVRSLRLAYVFGFLTPVHIIASVVSHVIYPRRTWEKKEWARGYFPNRMPTWSLVQTIWIPLVGSIFWAIVYGSPPSQTVGEETLVPYFSKSLFGSKAEGYSIEAETVSVPALPTTASTGKERRSGSEHNSECTTVDPYHEDDGYDVPATLLKGFVRGDQCNVGPQAVPSFWLWKAAIAKGKAAKTQPETIQEGLGSGPASGPDERAIIYFVGGGYHTGSAVSGPLAWSVCRLTGLRLLGVNFRKATSAARSFPAALQDALAAWVYVTRRLRFKPENVILMGDSAGAGLVLALQLYLSSLMVTHRGTSEDLGRARKIILHSPFADLTLGTQAFVDQIGVDILNPTMCSFARDNYLRHVISIPGRSNAIVDGKQYGLHRAASIAKLYNLDRASQSQKDYNAELFKLAKELPDTVLELGAAHPFFSMALSFADNPYLEQCMQLLAPLPSTPSDKPDLPGSSDLQIFLTVGTAETLYEQIQILCSNLKSLSHPGKADGVKLTAVESIDQHHVYVFFSPPGQVRADIDRQVNAFVHA